MKKFFGLVAALLAVSLVSFGFVACSDDDDDDLAVVASYKYTGTQNVGMDMVLYAYDDNTWALTASAQGQTAVTAKGTYTVVSGDFTNGKVTIKTTHDWDDEKNSLEPVDEEEEETIEITAGKFNLYGQLPFEKQ